MTVRFWAAFAAAGLTTLGALAAAAWAIVALTTEPPRERYMASMYEFELPQGWHCMSEGTEQICRHGNKPPYAAIAIVTAKYRNAQDTLAAYEQHLSQSLTNQTPSGKRTVSKMIYVKRRWINSREWVEGLHLGSEVANYYTYYLAAVTSHVGVLVTFSVHKRSRTRLEPELEIMMQTLRIHQRPDA